MNVPFGVPFGMPDDSPELIRIYALCITHTYLYEMRYHKIWGDNSIDNFMWGYYGNALSVAPARLTPSHWPLGKKKNCYVALTRPKFKNWVGRSGFFFFFFFFTYRERVEFSNIFFKVSKWGKLGRNAVKTHIQVMQVLF